MTEQEIAQLQETVATLQETVATLQAEKVTLQDQVTLLTQQKAVLEEEAETQGARLTTALDDLTAMTANRDLYKGSNAALQEAIHKATASIPEMQQVKLFALEQMEETLVAAIRSVFAGMIAEAKGQ